MELASAVMNRIPTRYLVPSIAWQYRFAEPELARLSEFVPVDRGAVDIGVWWGPWTWQLAHRVPRVDSFEPNHDLVERLRPIMPKNVHIHPVALSNCSGESSLWVPSRGVGTEGRASLEPAARSESGWSEQSVATSRLDDFKLDDVGFVKIDVEGHELAVLEGASGLLASQRPNLMIEIEEHSNREGRFDAIVGLLESLSYRGTFLHRGQWHPIDRLDRVRVRELADRVARHGYATNVLLYARRYTHNFLFRPT